MIVVNANSQLPSLTAQDVGRELYHGRQDVVQIVGDEGCLKKIAWIFHRVPDTFDARFQYASLIVRRARVQTDQLKTIDADIEVIPLPVGDQLQVG